jgi:hypothetical protein
LGVPKPEPARIKKMNVDIMNIDTNRRITSQLTVFPPITIIVLFY